MGIDGATHDRPTSVKIAGSGPVTKPSTAASTADISSGISLMPKVVSCIHDEDAREVQVVPPGSSVETMAQESRGMILSHYHDRRQKSA